MALTQANVQAIIDTNVTTNGQNKNTGAGLDTTLTSLNQAAFQTQLQSTATAGQVPVYPGQNAIPVPTTLFGIADLRWFGTSANVNAAVVAAMAAGYTTVILPAGWTYVPPPYPLNTGDSCVPAGLTIIGENRLTSIVASRDVVNAYTFLASGSVLENVSTQDKWSYDNVPPTGQTKKVPISYLLNNKDDYQLLSVYPGAFTLFFGPLTIDGVTLTDGNCLAVNNTSAGGGIFSSTSGAATGSCLDVATESLGSGGYGDYGLTIRNGYSNPSALHTGLYLTEFGTNANGKGLHLERENGSTTPLIYYNDVGPAASTADITQWFFVNQTTGSVFNIYHATSNWGGDIIYANVGNGTGSFTGNYLSFHNAGNLGFNVDYRGVTLAQAFLSPPVQYAALPSPPAVGMIACVNNSSVNTWGGTADGAGGDTVLVWYNGSAWTVIGK